MVRSDYDPRLARKVFLREGLSSLAYGVMTPFGFLKSRHEPLRKKDIRTVVFIHGYATNRAGFFPLQAYLKLRGFKRQYAFNYRSSGSIEGLAIELKRQLDDNIKGGRIDLVCHSMGGVVARYYLQQLGGHRRVDRLVTLGTPHLGSESYVYVPTNLIAQLKPGGPFLEHLNAIAPPRGVRVLSLAAARDIMVLPRQNALCPFGERRMFEDLGHTGLLLSPAVFKSVLEALDQSALDRDAPSIGGHERAL